MAENFQASDICYDAKETCNNWFCKIGSIHELLPRMWSLFSFLTLDSCILEFFDWCYSCQVVICSNFLANLFVLSFLPMFFPLRPGSYILLKTVLSLLLVSNLFESPINFKIIIIHTWATHDGSKFVYMIVTIRLTSKVILQNNFTLYFSHKCLLRVTIGFSPLSRPLRILFCWLFTSCCASVI